MTDLAPDDDVRRIVQEARSGGRVPDLSGLSEVAMDLSGLSVVDMGLSTDNHTSQEKK